MILKNKFFILLCATLFVLLLTVSCLRRGDASGKIVLNVLNYMDLTTPNLVNEVNFVWSGFLNNNEDIAINREDLYNEPFHNKTEAYAASGNLPDVFYVWPAGRSTSLHQNRLLKDLGVLVERDGLFDSYIPQAMDPANQGGGYIGMIPIALTSTHAFYVNMEVLEACGLVPAKTYAELRAQVPVLRSRGYETVIMANREKWVMQSCLFSMLAGRFGGQHWEKKILSAEAKFTDPEFVNALDFVRQMYADGVLSNASMGTSYGDSPGMFATNKGAYMIDGDWRVGTFLTDISTGQALLSPERQKNILITVFPDIEGAKINRSTSGALGTGWAMSASIEEGSAKEDAAWRLIKWLTGSETQTHRVENGGITTPSWANLDLSGLDLEPMQIKAGNLAYEYNVTTCVIDNVFHPDVSNPLNDGLAEIGMRTKTPQQVASDVQRVFDIWKRNR